MLTPEQIAKRRFSIGSSDAPSVCNVNPWRSSYDVWLEKTGRIEPFAGNDETRAGDLLEPAVIQHAVDVLKPIVLDRGTELTATGLAFITATLDGAAVLPSNDRCIIEAKTGGICSMLSGDGWGEPETDEIPEHYMVQVQHQLFVAGEEYQFAVVSALIPPRGFVLYYVPRVPELIAAIVQKEIEFWGNVQSDTPPDGMPSMDALKRMRRTPNKTVEVDPVLVEMYRIAQEKAKAAEKEADEAKKLLLAALGDAEAGDAGSEMITYMETSRRAYSVEATKYRSLKIKKGKR